MTINNYSKQKSLIVDADFFNQNKIKLIESMTNGTAYLFFYFKLLCESIEHDGYLRFNDEIFYDVKMLATITNTDFSTAAVAMDIFKKFGLIEVQENGEFYIPYAKNRVMIEEVDMD